jgi:hypothetical protein
MFLPDQNILLGSDPTTMLLLLCWKELFDPYTPDTFQPRLYDLPALVNELRTIAVRARNDERWRGHQKAVQAEIAAALDEDSSFVQRMPYLAWACGQLSNSQDSTSIERLGKSLDGYRAIYEREVKQELQQAVSGLPLTKAAALTAIRRVATIALNRGHSEREAQEICSNAAFKLNPSEWVERLLAEVEVAGKEVMIRDCVVPVFGAEHKILRKVLETSEKLQVVTRSALPFRLPENLRRAVFVRITGLRGGTETGIARSAIRSLRPALDIFGFYERIHVTIGDIAWVGSGLHGRLISTAGECLRRIPPRKHSSIRLTKAALEIPDDLLNHRILNALEHYTLAQSNSAFRVKLINLWSAVECLCPSETPGNVFDRVRSTVTPIVVWRRIDKITRYLASTLTRFRQSGYTSNLGPGFLPEGVVTAEEVLLALCRPNDHPHITGLLAGTSCHPLLMNRIFILWKRFSDPNLLLKDMTVSRQRTDWHLLRIYRARNLIVHEGHEVAATAYLVDNLQYYFSVTLSRILHGMALNKGWEVEDSAVHWTNRSSYVLEMLKTAPWTLKVKDFFPITIRCVHDRPWPLVTGDATTAEVPAAPAPPPLPPEQIRPTITNE